MTEVNKAIFYDIQGGTYEEVWKLQTQFHDQLKAAKKEAALLGDTSYRPIHRLIFCEHNPVYTLGKSGKKANLLLDDRQLSSGDIEYFKINRGGDITYHGPGQITGYPIFDMDYIYTDVRRYVQDLEDITIQLLESYGIQGSRISEYTGVWIKDRKPYRKICAIGVHMSRWVTLHGFALNVATELSYFKNINPCGIVDSDKDVTSLSQELGYDVDIGEVKLKLKELFADKFSLKYLDI